MMLTYGQWDPAKLKKGIAIKFREVQELMLRRFHRRVQVIQESLLPFIALLNWFEMLFSHPTWTSPLTLIFRAV